MSEQNPGYEPSLRTGNNAIPEEDIELVLEAIRLVVNSGKGYGEIVLTFSRGKLENVRPTPDLKPKRGG